LFPLRNFLPGSVAFNERLENAVIVVNGIIASVAASVEFIVEVVPVDNWINSLKKIFIWRL